MAEVKTKKRDNPEEKKVVHFGTPEEDIPNGDDGGKKKRARKEKKSREKKIKSEKKRSGVSTLIFLVVFLLCVCGFLYLSVAQDWGNVRTKLIHAVSTLDPNYRTLSQKIEEYNIAQRALEEAQADLAAQQAELVTQQEELAKKSAQVAAREANTAPIAMRGYSEEKISEFTLLAETYAQMEPGVACDIISRLPDVTHMAVILYYMTAESRAEILSVMNRDLASKVTSEILRT